MQMLIAAWRALKVRNASEHQLKGRLLGNHFGLTILAGLGWNSETDGAGRPENMARMARGTRR